MVIERAASAERRSARLVGGAVVLLVLLGGCAREQAPAGYLPSGPAVVEVVEQDHGYLLDPKGEIPAGRTVFRVRNPSALAHDLSLVALPEDLPPIIEQLRSDDRQTVITLARLPSRPPGSADAFAVDLPAGRYALVCFEKDAGGEVHALKGQAVELRVVSSNKQAAGE